MKFTLQKLRKILINDGTIGIDRETFRIVASVLPLRHGGR